MTPARRPSHRSVPLRLDVEFRLFPEVLTYLEQIFEPDGDPEIGHRRARYTINSEHASILMLLLAQTYLAATTDRRPKPGAIRGFFLNPLGLTALAISSALFILGVINLLGWVAGL